jgi:ankyrin repeat protein
MLDVALAWSVMNNHFDVADFLLDHGADINTTWSSHEPASILQELVFHGNYEAMQGPEDGSVAGGGRTAAGKQTMSSRLAHIPRTCSQLPLTTEGGGGSLTR